MAIFDGKKIRGIVGKTVFKNGRGNTSIVQKAPVAVRQTKATKKSANLFGQGSVLAGAIRYGLSFIIQGNYDPDMINRFNKPVRSIINRCYNKTTETFAFAPDSFEDLIGFEFNSRSWLINSLYVKPETNLTGNIFKISFPEINVKEQLKFPAGSNLCQLEVCVSYIVLDQAMTKHSDSQSVEISDAQETLPAQEFTFETPEGCLCIAGLGLNYFNKQEDVKTVMASKTFHPANICGAVITAGTFVDPGFRKIGYRTIPSPWQSIAKMKLHSS